VPRVEEVDDDPRKERAFRPFLTYQSLFSLNTRAACNGKSSRTARIRSRSIS